MYEKGIETFLAVAMSRTLGKAAGLLNVAQSTVSYNLNELEREMGMILVDRQKGMKIVSLTPAGESFLPIALKWQEVMKEFSNMRSPGSAYSLTVGASESVNTRIITDIYRRLISYTPPVYLRIVTDPSDMMYEAVESRALDCAVTLHEENSRYVKSEPFYKENFTVARIPENGEQGNGIISPSELKEDMEFYIEWNGGYRIWHEHIWDSSKQFKNHVDSLSLVTQLMCKPGQWCIIPQSSIEYFKSGINGVVFDRLSEVPPDVTYYKLTHKYPKVSSIPGLAVFDELLKHIAEDLKKDSSV